MTLLLPERYIKHGGETFFLGSSTERDETREGESLWLLLLLFVCLSVFAFCTHKKEKNVALATSRKICHNRQVYKAASSSTLERITATSNATCILKEKAATGKTEKK